MVPIYNVLIRRDAHTITPVTVPLYEVPILQTIFGKENVQNMDGKPLNENKLSDADIAGDYQPTDNESARLASKYGGNEKGLYVEAVYGPAASGRLDEVVERAAKPAEKAGGSKK